MNSFEDWFEVNKYALKHIYDKLIEFSENKNIDFKSESVIFKTGFYNMNINADYNKLLLRLKTAKDFL